MEPIIKIVTGLFALIYQMIFFIKDDRAVNHTKEDNGLKLNWHLAGGIIHGWMYYCISDSHGYRWGLLMASLTWLLFDGCINSFALRKEFFYVGKTAIVDRLQQGIAGVVSIDVRTISAILKIGFTAYSIYILIKHYGNF